MENKHKGRAFRGLLSLLGSGGSKCHLLRLLLPPSSGVWEQQNAGRSPGVILPLSLVVRTIWAVSERTHLHAFSADLDKPGKMSRGFVAVCSTDILLRLSHFRVLGNRIIKI